MTHRSRRRTAALVAVLVMVVCGVALGYWRAGGSGSGTASSTTPGVLMLSPGTPTGQLYPGTSAAVVTTMANPAGADVRVGSLALDTTEGEGGYDVDREDCALDALTFTTQTNGGAGWAVPGNGSLTVSMPGSLTMALSADDECQGAVFTVYLKVAG